MMQMNDSVDVQLIQTVESARQVLHPWLQEQQVGEAMGAHYALYANANQIKLLVAVQAQAERPLGYLVVAPTRLDLFHPLVVLRTNHGPVGELLLRAGLSLQQSYYVTMPAVLADQLACQWLPAEAELLRMYSLSRDDFSPVWHPLVRGGLAADGSPRFEVRLQEQTLLAVAGINWQSQHFAEVYVQTAQQARGRGYGRAVVTALATHILKSGRTPLYVVSETNAASIRLAEALGFVDSGEREYAGFITRSLLSNTSVRN
jgi:RimJ/RimL family protein N-acetyltransferase